MCEMFLPGNLSLHFRRILCYTWGVKGLHFLIPFRELNQQGFCMIRLHLTDLLAMFHLGGSKYEKEQPKITMD